MKISIIIITLFKRNLLKDCLNALHKQSRAPDELIVVGSKGESPEVHYIDGSYTSIVGAVNAGILASRGDIIVFTEDDIIPYPNWIEKIEYYLSDNGVGSVGGPDEIWRDGRPEGRRTLEIIGRLGRGEIIGEHNENAPDQDVDFLKGCNMAVRSSLCPLLDKNLVGFYRWEQDICFHIKNKGKRLLFRNDVRVRHIKYDDKRVKNREFVFGYNTSYLIKKYLPGYKARVFFLWSLITGDGSSPGILRMPKRVNTGVLNALKGKIRGWKVKG